MGWENWNGDQIISNVIYESTNAIYDSLEVIGTISDSQIPLNEGTLKASKTIKRQYSSNPKGSISYGGGRGTGKPKIPYAVRWHYEQANFQHGRKRFYLRDPIVKYLPHVLRMKLNEHLRSVL